MLTVKFEGQDKVLERSSGLAGLRQLEGKTPRNDPISSSNIISLSVILWGRHRPFTVTQEMYIMNLARRQLKFLSDRSKDRSECNISHWGRKLPNRNHHQNEQQNGNLLL
jgi:hypothetical protein